MHPDRQAWVTAFAALIATLLCDVAFASARGQPPEADYLLLCSLLALAAAGVVGAVASRVRGGAPLVLALWAGLHGLFLLGGLWALGFGAVTFAFASAYRPARGRIWSATLAVTLALGLAFMLWPRLGMLLERLPRGIARSDLARVVVFTVALAGIFAYSRARAQLARSPSETQLLVIAMLACFLMAPAAVRSDGSRAFCAAAASADPARPNIIVLILDTVRADHLSVYGYRRPTTPKLAEFVRQSDRAIVYDMAFAPAPSTVPSTSSLLTGKLPSDHGAHYAAPNAGDRSLWVRHAIRAERTLAELLREQGYRTAAIVANTFLLQVEGLERGFETFYQPPYPKTLLLVGEALRARFLPQMFAYRSYPEAPVVNEEALQYLEDCGDAPFFLLVNYMEAHSPYRPRAPHAGAFSSGVEFGVRIRATIERNPASERPEAEISYSEALYDEEILSLDDQVGRLLTELQTRGFLDRTWLIITSDHGESFGEHRLFDHDTGIYNDQVRVPLIVQPPIASEPLRRIQPVGHLDLAATIAAVAGVAGFGAGRDLRQLHGPGSVQIEFHGTSQYRMQRMGLDAEPARAVVSGTTKLLERKGRYELYRLDGDMSEARNLARDEADVVGRLAPLLPPLRAERTPVGKGRLSEDDREALRALGYID